MKICYFADSESIHTIRWCNHFKSLGHEVHLITLKSAMIDGIQVYPLDLKGIKKSGGNWKSLFKYRKVKRLLKQIQPDIFHSLYATSYGVTGSLAGHKNYVITALGSDLLISARNSFIY